mgnify:CR=1 FL=1
MTETAKVEVTNGKHAENGDMSELDKEIHKQVKKNLKTRKSILYYLNVGTLNDKMTLVIWANFDSGLCIDSIAMQYQFNVECF